MPDRLKAIIIDDEERARRLLVTLLETYCTDDIQVLGTCSTVPEGVLEINRQKPDVVFLDIEMPDYSGFELLEFFREVDFEVIFVTAFNQYAVKAFEVSAVDYLLKPIQIDLLEQAVKKLKERLHYLSMYERIELLKSNLETDEIKKIAVPVSDGLVLVRISEISHIDADGSYTRLYLADGSNMMVSKKLIFFERLLANQSSFYRVHRSHLVNLTLIKRYNRNERQITLENQHKILVAKSHKTHFEEKLKDFLERKL